MKSLLVASNELRSSRFERLCEQSHMPRVEAWWHLSVWYSRWTTDEQLDCGLFWNVNEARMGAWAEHPRPLAWGRALVAAGYIYRVEDVYPSELCGGRSGFVAAGPGDVRVMLDSTWDGVHRQRPGGAREWVKYLTTPARRAGALAAVRERYGEVDMSNVPADWFPTGPGAPPGGATLEQRRGNVGGFSYGDSPSRTVDEMTISPSRTVSVGSAEGAPRRSPPPPSARDGGTEGNGTEGKRTEGSGTEDGTGSQSLFAFVRENRHSDLYETLCQIDGRPTSARFWRVAVRDSRRIVEAALDELTETESYWHRVQNKGSWLVSKIKRMTERRRLAEGGGGERRNFSSRRRT
jgi:hypothetical protein